MKKKAKRPYWSASVPEFSNSPVVMWILQKGRSKRCGWNLNPPTYEKELPNLVHAFDRN